MAVVLDKTLGTNSDADANTSSITLTTNNAVAAGATVFCSVDWWSASATISSVTGTNGLTWTVDQTGANGNDQIARLSAPAPAGLSSGVTIIVNFSVACTGHGISAASFTGVTQTTDGKSSNTSNVWASPSLTTTASDLLLGNAVTDGAQTSSSPTSPSLELSDFFDTTSNATWASEYRIETTGAAYTVAGTWAAAGSVGATVIVAYKAVAAVGTIPPVHLPFMR